MREIIYAAVLAATMLSGCGEDSSSVIELSPEVMTETQIIAPDNVYDILQVLDVQKQKMFIIPCDGLPDAEVDGEQELNCFENDEMGIHNGGPLLFYTGGKEVPYDKSKGNLQIFYYDLRKYI